jgi:negative regulator of sigma E activity
MVGQPSDTSHRKVRCGTYAVALAPVFVLAAAVTMLNPGAQLERGLATAAAGEARLMAEAVQTTRRAPAIASRAAEEGTEAFWLTRAPDAENVARVTWTAPVAAGDRVVVNFGAYKRQILDVVSVEPDDAATTHIDTSAGKTARYIVTGRLLSDPDAAPVRLTVDQEGRGLTMVSGEADRAL